MTDEVKICPMQQYNNGWRTCCREKCALWVKDVKIFRPSKNNQTETFLYTGCGLVIK